MKHEAFVYRWYDAPNDMYYLGKHKGSPDDSYTHSSSVWPSFTKETIPEGVTREIIAEGTDEEMTKLEHILLKFAKENGNWDRYYNESIGDPQVVDQWGKNNHMYGKGFLRTGQTNPNWKGGERTNNPVAYMREYDKKRNQTPERKEWFRKVRQTPERKAYMKEYNKAYRARKKSEKQGTGTLKKFFHE